MKRLSAVVLAVAVTAIATAHVGSPNVLFDGSAGAYPVRVIVRPPLVVPGLAEVIVRTTAGDVQRIVIQPVFWRTGVAGAPRGDEMSRVAGQPGTFTGQLWLMARGSYSVYVDVHGGRGDGRVIVPVNSVATGRLGLSPGLTAVLAVLGLTLVAGLVTIVRAAVGESLVAPGGTLEPTMRRRANVVAIVAVPALALILFGGAKWWNAVDAEYRHSMFRPPAVDASLGANGRTLRLGVHDTSAYRAIFSPVAPDHGKMMHLFLVRSPSMDAFAHLHPAQTDSLVFVTTVPDLPPGDYRLFGDIVLENGMSLTVSNTVTLADVANSARSDSDDAWTPNVVAGTARSNALAPMGHGYRLAWAGGDGPLPSKSPFELRFIVIDAAGNPARLEPYLGMAAHAVVLRDDGSVFIHLHPMGTVATTAQQIFKARDRGDTTARGRLRPEAFTDSSMMPMSFSGALSFPYEFPNAGRYRIWVQAKPGREILTGAFDVEVR
ncbi:MAG TPA: hypothetical protein VGP95_03320 [Gemmatimonadaceae bacterium]|nr:hypothetical protein [Gemmatimonadaceae bacterium]